jgi:nucleolar complex protein 2
MTKKGKPSMQKQTEMASQLKIANKMLGTKVYQDMVIKECIDLIEDYLSIYAYSISFPELSIPATINLKRYLKQCKVPFFRKRVSTIIDEVLL